jgi:lysophospholipase L1-like esterase
VISNERSAREKTFEFLKHSQIAYVDTLPALRRSLSQELYARTASDIHPNRNGYRVIGEALFEALKRNNWYCQPDHNIMATPGVGPGRERGE